MFERPVSRVLARELAPEEIAQVSGADDMDTIGDGTCWGPHGTESTENNVRTEDDRERIRD